MSNVFEFKTRDQREFEEITRKVNEARYRR
jgi:hypothetical protein